MTTSIITFTDILNPFFMREERRKFWFFFFNFLLHIFEGDKNHQNIGNVNNTFWEYILNASWNLSRVEETL